MKDQCVGFVWNLAVWLQATTNRLPLHSPCPSKRVEESKMAAKNKKGLP